MFGTTLRVAVTFLAGALLLWIWQTAMDPFVGVMQTQAAGPSEHAAHIETTVLWMPLFVLLSLAVWWVSAAIFQRRAV